VEKDLIIHRILKQLLSSPHFAENYLFKGGSCLVKCYFIIDGKLAVKPRAWE
jgi:predicted nucleotidyltransferase component of viral defense system